MKGSNPNFRRGFKGGCQEVTSKVSKSQEAWNKVHWASGTKAVKSELSLAHWGFEIMKYG